MLEAEYLAYVTSNIESLFNDLEEEILIDIARRIRQNDFSMTSTAQYQMDQLKALGIAEKDIQSLIAKTLKKSEKEVAKVIEESAYKTLESDNDIFKLAYERGAIPSFHYQPNAFKSLILSGVKATNGEIKNICKTTANKAQQAFINASDKVFLQVSSGAFDYESACLNAIKDLSSKGLGVINYRTGARRRLDGAIRNAVRTGLNQTACKCQDKNFDEMGGNLVETTSHMGARPEHALWQGQVFWRKKKYKNYRNFEQATGYGTGAGLGGWNCRHSFYPFFEEISSQAFEKYRLGENEEFYELTQEQRYNERKIREWSQRANICKAGGVDNSRELNKVREWKNRQKEFLKEHLELKRVYANEKTYLAINRKKIKEYYFTDNKNVRMKVSKEEMSIKGNKFESSFVFDSKGNIILSKKGLEHEVEFTSNEISKMKDGILTHNHPINTPFSPDDLYFMIDANLQEMRVVTEYGIHILRRNENLHVMPNYDSFMKEYEILCKKYSTAYRIKHTDWRNDKERWQRILQNNAFERIAKKYGLDYKKGQE